MIETFGYSFASTIERTPTGFLADLDVRRFLQTIAQETGKSATSLVPCALLGAAAIVDAASDVNGLDRGGRLPYSSYAFWQPLISRILAALMLDMLEKSDSLVLSEVAAELAASTAMKLARRFNGASTLKDDAALLMSSVGSEVVELTDTHRNYVMIELQSVAWRVLAGRSLLDLLTFEDAKEVTFHETLHFRRDGGAQ